MARLTDRPRTDARTSAPTAEAPPRRPQADTGGSGGDGGKRGTRFGLPRTFESFRDREFRWFYLSMLGQMASMNMQLVVRAYLAYVLTGSYAALGLVGLMGGLAMLVLAPFGGVMADRLPKKTVLQVGQVASLLNAAALAVLTWAGGMTLEWLLVSALAQGIVMALTMPTRQAMIPDIVGMDRMQNAVSLNMAGMNTMRLFAPAAGGFIIDIFGFGWAFAAMAMMFGFAILALAQVTHQAAIAPGKAGDGIMAVAVSSFRDIGEGVKYITRTRLMLALLSISFISSIFGMPYQFLLPGYTADIFDGTGSDVGLLLGLSAVGALAGALVLASLPSRNRGWMLLAGTTVLGIGLLAFVQTQNFWVAAGFLMIVGVGSSFRQALSQGLLHAHVENAYRGRVMSVFMMQMSMMQLSTFFVGMLGDAIGIQMAIGILGGGLIATTLLFTLFVPSIRRLQ
ncbi:MAG: MFS transporter [Chloroflexi bacterium]|nr:MFS transporter [Chloroflexota bacterium]MDA1241122.1 MFS transporter [Chloroflexota bacterium]MQC48478.1 MFS transporter [Chloroflexota bacterium]